ncbi:MAG: hypothetical protein JSV85_06495 [Candidatus Bathyarchaeota archaeon]|nr:MAG: hypothetical protein JSV85_06495 [Candidatus Bathyarchaeota archaeon]
MSKKRKIKEILVDTSVLKRREEELLRDTTGSESYDVFKVSARFGRLSSGLVTAVGVALLGFSLYILFINVQLAFLDSGVFFFSFLGFLGAVNILGGLLLLAKE